MAKKRLILLISIAAVLISSLPAFCKGPAEMKLAQHVITDTEANMKAMVVTAPAAWKFEGGVLWDFQSIALPARVQYRVTGNSDGAEVFYVPLMNFHYQSPMLVSPPVGRPHNGTTFMPPMKAEEVIKEMFLSIRPNASGTTVKSVSRPKWLDEYVGQLTEQARAAAAGQNMKIDYDVAEIVFEYTEGGKKYEEHMSTSTGYLMTVLQTGQQSVYTMWSSDPIFCRRAYSGKYQAHAAAFEIIEKNSRSDPRWQAAVAAVGNRLIQNQITSIKAGGEITRQMVAEANKLRSEQTRVFEDRQAAYDRINRKRGDALIGVDRYNTSEGNTALPSGYSHVWERKSGEIIMNNNPNFNPNEGDAGQWRQVKRID